MGFLNLRALRWKVAALTATACCAVATVVGLLVHEATAEHGQRAGDERVSTQLRVAIMEFQRTGKRPEAASLMTPDDVPEPLAHALAERQTADAYAIWYDVKEPNWYWLWAAVPVEGGRVLSVRTDMSSEVRSLQLLDRSIIKAVLAALVVVVPLAALATEPMNRRLRHGARTARRIADGDLDARIGHPGRARDEITEMSAAMDAMAGALQRRLESEKRFTADVAHELRTPLMGLLTSAGLLADDDEAASLVRERVGTLRGLVEDLLEISRLDAGAEQARLDEVPLGELITDVVRRGENCGGTPQVLVDGADVVRTDPRRVERIVTNLIANAHRHGAGPVRVTVTGSRIVVRDHGPGYPSELLTAGPQRFRTGATGQGHGLGLTIALGQAKVLGARLVFANADDGGAEATLELPRSPDLTRRAHAR
ncbi:HAMP domain-containing histidine kinase [Streptomyces sp. NBC_00237]|uniref:sensor histidine kinase n=1 Tax=Streptomyces sp. NBC_00237 TaxID=2975687 RepID=UPI002251C172|nr:HAMP domain-containing sensor histidine kinase [Streptomyces sp. NBC_00237]MCX5205645.1 HAMP domain-containing histidine kinase [Streptomyces sp. NBC_00237]